MSIKKLALLSALGLSMASTSVMAQTSSVARTGAAIQEANDQGNSQGRGRGNRGDDMDEGGWGNSTTTYIIAFFVIIVIAIGIYFALDKDDDGRTSP